MDTRSQVVAEIRIIGPGEAGLMDRLRLVVFPQILGETGREPIFAGLPDIDLELAGTNVLDGRLVTLEYRPATAD
jgi:riboflavin biosynthesis pyrimidine reductase